MDEDEDGPPMLIAADGDDSAAQASLVSEMAEVALSRVPISIITGRRLLTDHLYCCRQINSLYFH